MDTNPSLPPSPGPPYPGAIEARVGVLEQIAVSTKEILVEIKQHIREIKREMNNMRSDQRSDFRLIFSALVATALGLAGVMAHGLNWL